MICPDCKGERRWPGGALCKRCKGNGQINLR
jgi:DnaJ-class molecular chaperone